MKQIFGYTILSRRESRTVKICLDYAWHRLKKHQNTGLHGLFKHRYVNWLRKQI